MKNHHLLCLLLMLSPLAQSGGMTDTEQEAWKALEEQTALFHKRDWAKHDKYIHPKAVLWGGFLPNPIGIKGLEYHKALLAQGGKVIAYSLEPVSVQVVGNVATINFYQHTLSEGTEAPVETVLRGHNTWVKEGSQWRLLSNYNTIVN